MYEYLIEGGFPIKGTITASGNKNAALPCIAATLLTAESVTLHNIPEIEDTSVMLNILQSFGVKATNIKKHSWKIEAKNVKASCIPAELSKKFVHQFFLQVHFLQDAEKLKCYLQEEM